MTTVPTLEDDFALRPDVVDGFARDGHAVVRGLLVPDEAAAFRPLVEELTFAHAWNAGTASGAAEDTHEGAFLQAFNLWRRDERMAAFVLSARLARVAAALLGVERVRLYHDQALCKGPRGPRTPWHQDHYYWPLDTDRTITLWMPLVDVPDEVGSMTFASGSHLLGDLGGGGIGKATDTHLRSVLEARGLSTRTHGALAAGDATFHTGWTAHSAPRNPSDLMRTVMTVIYYADGARVLPAVTEAQDTDRRAWLGDRSLGALADHELNPVLG